MSKKQEYKQTILIADDSEMNRAILTDMLEDEYIILEAEDGVEAVSILQKHENEISAVLLDIVMPNMDGFGVLKIMNQQRWIEDIPVIMISSESGASQVERAYALGIADFINRPFNMPIVHRRLVNTMLLYAKQKKLAALVAEQVYENEKQSAMMIDILSHIVEFRNGESALHVVHVHTLTELMLSHLIQLTDRYPLTQADISMISRASALHDIGKISIPSEILNKPGRLTFEEFAAMKIHTTIGAEMLKELTAYQNEPLVKTAHDICRWHHERYDGHGYPDGLKGDEIPISAQIVALADVYDALTSERVYKKAYSHDVAIHMILNGECGTFNPLLMQCLEAIADVIEEEFKNKTSTSPSQPKRINEAMLDGYALPASGNTLQLMEYERMKYAFFSSRSNAVHFEYTFSPAMLMLRDWLDDKLGLPEIVMNPLEDKDLLAILGQEALTGLEEALKATTSEQPIAEYDCIAHIKGQDLHIQFICQTTWSSEETPQCTGAIGKAMRYRPAAAS